MRKAIVQSITSNGEQVQQRHGIAVEAAARALGLYHARTRSVHLLRLRAACGRHEVIGESPRCAQITGAAGEYRELVRVLSIESLAVQLSGSSRVVAGDGAWQQRRQCNNQSFGGRSQPHRGTVAHRDDHHARRIDDIVAVGCTLDTVMTHSCITQCNNGTTFLASSNLPTYAPRTCHATHKQTPTL